MLIPWMRKRIGWTLFLGGYLLLAYEIYIWRAEGLWNLYPLALPLEWVVHNVSVLMESFPYAKDEGIEMWARFSVSDLPPYFSRFFKVVPVSAFSLVTGYFFIRWEKYLGLK